MSDYLAVGGVSAVLCYLLNDALTKSGPTGILSSPPHITAKSPDLVPTGANEQACINIFMYYASLNPALRNMGMPSRSVQGAAISNDPLAINLHYLVSAYGSVQFDPEILLAWAMKVFHGSPVLSRAVIQTGLSALLSGSPTPEATLIATSTLANQIEHVRITPETLTTEEIYRLWTAFQTHYRPTTSYQVSVVVIQDTQPIVSSLPVQRRTVTVLPLSGPVIDSLTPTLVAVGDTLTINGRNFIGDAAADTLVSFDGAAGIAPATVQSSCVRVVIPATLQAGTRAVRVVRAITFPLSPTPHQGSSSSPVPFQLVPKVLNAAPIQVAQGATLTLQVSPPVGSSQSATLYIGDTAIPIDERPVTAPTPAATLSFPIPAGLAPATYPLRVEIDGAQSKVTLDSTQGSPTYGQYLPQIAVTT
ncbi:MAG TPA: Pvc16 family protein [Polyangiaceae bacterium]|jgi:hypothetical protein|nr:Pvc16 family protein [Polyangiaceae bacterium]